MNFSGFGRESEDMLTAGPISPAWSCSNSSAPRSQTFYSVFLRSLENAAGRTLQSFHDFTFVPKKKIFHPGKLIFTAFFFCSAEMFTTFLHEGRELLFTYVFFSTIFFSRNDVSGQRFREAEGEASPQSPPAGALLL